MTSATTWESLRELPARRHVAGFLDQRLLVRGTAAQGVEADATPLQIHLRPYQAMLPQRVHRKGAPQQPHLPTLVAPSQKDQTPRRSGFDACRAALPVRDHVAGRLRLYPVQGLMMKPRPDLGLPLAVEAFDRCLETHLPRGNEDRDHSEAQAGPRHPADGIRVDLRPLEGGIVVELGVARQAHRPPVLDQAFHGELCGDDRVRPGHDQPAVQGDAVEDLDRNATLDDQALDAIKAIQLGTPISDVGQVPPRRWWGT